MSKLARRRFLASVAAIGPLLAFRRSIAEPTVAMPLACPKDRQTAETVSAGLHGAGASMVESWFKPKQAMALHLRALERQRILAAQGYYL